MKTPSAPKHSGRKPHSFRTADGSIVNLDKDGITARIHDKPDYKIELHFLFVNSSKLWIHCKNTQALDYLIQFKELNIFWHEEDHYTITSKGVLWAHPKSEMTCNTIIVMPEHKNNQYDFTKCLGICTDYINNFT